MYGLKIERVKLNTEKLEVEGFLSTFNLRLDKDVEYTLGARFNNELVGTCSFAGNVVKCFAVREDLQGEGVAGKLLSEITNIMFDKGMIHTFVFTKPENKHLFTGFGYYEIYTSRDVVLLESGLKNIRASIEKMYKDSNLGGEEKAAIVMNCNPFTLGHQELIRQASLENETVVVFIVEEDRSLFPFNIRYHLVKEGTKEFKNVHVIPGGDYIISSNTFPSYFIKEEEKRDEAFSQLDAGIFGKYIAPIFNIQKRYVGTEPYCPVTREYNEALSKILPKFNVELRLVERKESHEGNAISASRVRECIRNDWWDELKNLLPQSTFDFLKTQEAEAIVNRIKEKDSRH